MERHPSAIKRNRQNEKRRVRNQHVRSTMRTALKKTLKVIEEGDKEKALESVKATSSIVAKTATKGVIRRNKASRTISRLVRKAAAMGAS